jgi:membrane protease YdiL (CAAX protease family)
MTPVQPAGIRPTIALFGLPSLALPICLYGGAWLLEQLSLPYSLIFVLTYGVLFTGFFLGTWFAVHREDPRSTSTRTRLRLSKPSPAAWAVALLSSAVAIVLVRSAVPLWPVTHDHLFNSPQAFARTQAGFFSWLSTHSIPSMLVLAGMLTAGVLAEEVWWRGYVLPRQEAVWPAFAWLINGLAWSVFHWSIRTSLGSWVVFAPVSLLIPYLAQRYKSIWPGALVHLLWNSSQFWGFLVGSR